MNELRETLSALPGTMRAAVKPLLPERAFLRRSRDEGLFVTDAPARCGDPGLPDRLRAAGFLCRGEGGLLVLSPDVSRLLALERAFPEPPDFFCASVARFREMPPSPEALSLFASGVRLLESSVPAERAAFRRKTRELAAVSLRNPAGGVYACALIDSVLNPE